MRIGFIDYVFDLKAPVGTDGLSEVVWNLADPLAARGNDVHVAGPYQQSTFPCDRVSVHPFSVPPIGYRNIVGHMLIVRRAIQILRAHGPFDVLHAPEYLSTAMLTMLMPGTPIVLTEPGNIYDRVANGNPYDWWTTQVLKVAARRSGRACATIIATSEEMVYWWKRCGAVEGRIARIPLGVNLEGFAHVPCARAVLGWPEDRPHILFAARLSPETGAQHLLHAMTRILQAIPGTLLHIVGRGSAEVNLRQLQTELGLSANVQWHGWVALRNLANYYSAADVMVFPGTSGGTPRVMLQAMACGTPFVGTAIGGIVDHVRPGVTGWLVPPRDPQALADAIIDMLQNREATRQRAAQAQVYVRELNWFCIAERVEREVYAKYCRSYT